MSKDCENLIEIFQELKLKNPEYKEFYLGSGKYSTTILYDDYAYKIYPIVCEGEEKGFTSYEHIKLLKEEVGWQHIASQKSSINSNDQLSPKIEAYFICRDNEEQCSNGENKSYFIIKMEYLKGYIDVDKFAEKFPHLYRSSYFQNKIKELVIEKNKRKIPNIGDGSQYLRMGIQALVNPEKVENREPNSIYLIDWGNTLDYGNIMEKLLKKYKDPLSIPFNALIRRKQSRSRSRSRSRSHTRSHTRSRSKSHSKSHSKSGGKNKLKLTKKKNVYKNYIYND